MDNKIATIRNHPKGYDLIVALSNVFLRDARDFAIIYNDPTWEVVAKKETKSVIAQMRMFAQGYLYHGN